jgi:hypothetical protein
MGSEGTVSAVRPAVTIAALGFVVALAGAVVAAAWAGRRASYPRPRTDVILGAALGPLAEIVLVELGAASYADDALFGVALWRPCLYFGAGAVASGLWVALDA